MVAVFVIAVERHRNDRPHAAVNLLLVNNGGFVLIYNAGACVALGIYIVMVFKCFIVLIVAVVQRHIELFRLFAAPLRDDCRLLGRFNSGLQSLDCFLFRLRDKYVCHILAAALVFRVILAEYVNVTQSTRAEYYLRVLNLWCNHNVEFFNVEKN